MTTSAPIGHGKEMWMHLFTFRLAGRLFGVDIHDVKEVVQDVALTPVSHAPPAVSGLVAIRGQIHLIVDLRVIFGFDQEPPSKDSRLVLFRAAVDEPFGILVDATDAVRVIATAEIVDRRRRQDRPPAAVGDRRRSAPDIGIGVCPLDEGLIVILHARGILGALARAPATRPDPHGS